MIFQDLLAWNEIPFYEAAEKLSGKSVQVEDCAKRSTSAVNSIVWAGKSAEAARDQVFEINQILTVKTENIFEVASNLRRISGDIFSVAQMAKAINNNRHYLVAADNSVYPTFARIQWAQGYPERYTQIKTDIQSLTIRVQQVLEEAARVEADLVRTFIDTSSIKNQSAIGEKGPALPQNLDNIAEVAQWWDALSSSERAWLIANKPEAIGNLDGVDMWARNQANQKVLDSEITRLEKELARYQQLRDYDSNYEDPQAPWREVMMNLNNRIGSLAAIKTAFSDAAWAKDHSLVYFNNANKNIEAAIGLGNLDKADHVGVFTPGMNSTISNLIRHDGSNGGYVNDMENLNSKTLNALEKAGRGGETVASVVWLGYQAPDPFNVMFSAPAQTGGHKLAGFFDGIHACRDTDPDLVALAHSYGSTTTGNALTEAQHVDRGVFFGSPGIGRGNELSDLNIPPEKLYFMEAKHDIVTNIFDGHGGSLADYGGHLEPRTSGGPAMQGAGTWVQEDYTLPRLSTREHFFADGTITTESSGHSEYTKPGSTAQHNLSGVLGNIEDKVELKYGE